MAFFDRTTATEGLLCSIETVMPVDDWSVASPAGFYVSRSWLGAVEQASPRDSVRYVVARNRDKLVVGWLPVYLFGHGEPAGLYEPHVAMHLTEVSSEGSRPLVLLGSRAGYLGGWNLDRSMAAADILRALVGAADVWSMEIGASLVGFEYLHPDEAAMLAATGLVAADELVVHSHDVVVQTNGSFDGYLAGLRASHRSVVTRDRRRFDASGFTLEHTTLRGIMDFGPRLLAAVQGRHGHNADVGAAARVLAAQAAHLDDASLAVVARDTSGDPVAYSVSFLCGDQLYVRLVGLDHDRAEASGAYFEVTYYEPLRAAASANLRQCHLGVGSLRPKLLRGGELRGLQGMLRRPGCDRMSTDVGRSVALAALAAARAEAPGLVDHE